MKKHHLFFLILFVISACTSSGSKPQGKPKPFNQGNLSFSIPADWHITDKEYDPEGIYYLSLEKKGLDESGIVTINWFDYQIGREFMLDVFREQMESEKIYQLSKIKFGETFESAYNGYESLQLDYTCSILGVDHSGSLIAFETDSTSVGLMIQEADEDNADNEPGFKTIQSSLKVK